MEAGAGAFLQWSPIPGDGCTFLKLGPEPDDVVRVRVPACNPLPGNPSDTPPSCGFPQPDTRCGPSPQLPTWWSTDQHDAVERPQGGRGMGLGGPASTTQPSWSPTPGPHISSPRGREATFPKPALPGCRRALWRPPRRRVLGTRDRLSGSPFQGSGPAVKSPCFENRATRTAPCPLPDCAQAPEHPRSAATGAQSWRGKCLASQSSGVPFPPGVPLPPRPGFPPRCEKMPHACTYLFILQQLQETMKLFHGAGQRALQPRCCCFQ